MAKVKIKGKNVTGTAGNDKITWLSKSAWKKALTVKADAGNDIINFKKSKYSNKLYGGKGDDTITSGKKNDFIYFNKYDGNDTILNGGGVDTIVFNKEKLKNIKAKYSKNDVILTYTGGKIKLKNYVKNGHSAQYIQVGKTKKAIEDLLPWNKVKRNGRNYIGTNKKDNVSSNTDKAIIKTFDRNDKIEILGIGNTVTAGKGNDTITSHDYGQVYIFNNGDGNDIITSGNENTFVFSDANSINDINIDKNSKGITIKYNNGKDSVSIIYDKGADEPTNFIKVGDELCLINRTEYRYYEEDVYSTIGTSGNDTFTSEIDGGMTYTIYTGYGNDTVNLQGSIAYNHPYFNMDADRNILGNELFVLNGEFWHDIDDFGNDYYSFDREGKLIVADYFSKGTTDLISYTWNDDYDDVSVKLDMSNIEEVKTAVAGWLSTHTDYANVIDAINDSANGSENLRILLGSDYFGKLNWQEIA